MTSVAIHSSGETYEAIVGPGLLDNAGSTIAKKIGQRPCAIISDTNAASLFADRAKQSLKAAGFDPILITIPAGEQSKTLEQAGTVSDEMIAAGLDRQSFVVGLGGGVVGGARVGDAGGCRQFLDPALQIGRSDRTGQRMSRE